MNYVDGDKGKRLVARCQTIDKVIADNMKCAATSVKSSDRAYQFSNELITCSNQVKLWEEILSQTRQRKPFTMHTLRLAEKIGYKIHIHQNFSIKTVRQKLTDARTKKTSAQKEDASNRQKWLEEFDFVDVVGLIPGLVALFVVGLIAVLVGGVFFVQDSKERNEMMRVSRFALSSCAHS